MKRLGFSAVSLMGALVVLCCAMQLAAVPSTVSFQGVLRSSSGSPVADGSYSTTFSLWNAPTGGSQLWIEVQQVSTTGGLFTVQLGKLESLGRIFADSGDVSLYLQVQVMINGTPVTMSPRSPIQSAPYSSTASSVEGDFKTKPGTIIVRPIPTMSGSTTGTIRMQATTDSGVSVVGWDHDDDGVPETYLSQISFPDSAVQEITFSSLLMPALMKAKEKANRTKCSSNLRCVGQQSDATSESDLSCDLEGFHGTWTGHHGSTTGTIRMHATGDSSISTLDMDSDNDGVSDASITQTCRSSATKLAIKTKGTGAQRNSSTTTVDQDSAYTVTGVDLDGDGVTEMSSATHVDHESASLRLNGLPPGIPVEGTLDLTTNGDSSTVTASSRFHNGPRQTVSLDGTYAHAKMECSSDIDNDGHGDVGTQCDAIVSSSILKTFFQTGDFPTQSRSAITDSVDANGSTTTMQSRLNGLPPGEPVIGTLSLTTTGSGAGIAIGDPGVNGVGMSTTGSSSTISATDRFSNGPRQTVSLDGSFSHAKMECSSDIDNDGTPDVGTSCDAIETRSTLKTYFETGDIPTESQSHVTTTADSSGTTTEMSTRLNGLPPGEPVIGTLSMSTSTTKAQVGLGNVTDDSYMEMSSDGGSGPGSAPSSSFRMGRPAINEVVFNVDATGPSLKVTKDNDNYVKINNFKVELCEHTVPNSSLDADGNGYLSSSLGVGVAPGSHHIDVAGGAYCDGTNWVNASSKALKENFKEVDDADVLEKVEELPITRWNYKSENDNVTHIGPTAEDFHKAFGVGETDKAISTIDPSGVALAAIKELAKKNKQLEAQNERLKKQMNDLQKAVEKLLKQNEKGR